MSEKTDRRGTTTSYIYDVHGRMTSQEAVRTGSSTVLISYTYDKNGNLRIVSNKTGATVTDTTTRRYDGLNRVKTKQVSNIGTITYTYDIIVERAGIEQGLTAQMSVDPKSNYTTKIFDKDGRLKYVIDGNATSGKICATYEYNPNGSLRRLTYEGGAKEEYTYWENGLLKKLVNKNPAGLEIDEYKYQYDKAQNMIRKTEKINNINKGTTVYQYDYMNRLKYVSEQDGTRIINYTFDAAGNRKTEIIVQGTTSIENIYSYNGEDLLQRIDTTEKVNGVAQSTYNTTYGYDGNGNMNRLSKNSVVQRWYDYDVLNRMIGVRNPDSTYVAQYRYNGEGLRISKIVENITTRYLYEYRNVVLEVIGGVEKGRNIYGTNLVNRTVDRSSTLYYLYNGRGDVTVLINSAGAVQGTYYYDAFGNILERTGTADNNIIYAGYQYDKETEIVENGVVVQTGLYYLNARMYDPNIARFLQEDTYRGDPRDSLSLNLYTYCHNEPIRYVDPTGYSRELSAEDLIRQIYVAKKRWELDIDKKSSHEIAKNARAELRNTPEYNNNPKIEKMIENYLSKKHGGEMKDLLELYSGIQSIKKSTNDIGKTIEWYSFKPSWVPSIVDDKGTGNGAPTPAPTPSQGTGKTGIYTYVDRYGNTVNKDWTISDEEFLDSKSLTQQQITDIMNSKNPGLVERGFDKAVYEYAQRKGINPKVILATLAQEQGWCRNGNYKSAFGVGPGGNPIDFAEGDMGGISISVNTFLKWFKHGQELQKEGKLEPMFVNYDPSPYPETKAVFGKGTQDWQNKHPNDVKFMEKGQYVTPVNAAMYAKLKYTPWLDFPPQGSHPLDQWHDIFRSFK